MQTKLQRVKRALTVGSAGLLFAYLGMIQLTGTAYAGSVSLAWDPNSESYLAGYNVYRSTQSGIFTAGPLNGTTLLRATSFTDSTVQSGTYFYTVRAVGTDGQESPASNEVQVTLTSLPTLTAPTGLVSQCSSDAKTFTVSWNPVSGAANYYLRIDNLDNNGTQPFVFVDGVDYYRDAYTQTSFTGSVISGQRYSWWVHAANATSGIGPAAFGSFTCTDATAPAVSITSPSNGATVSGVVTVAASASDNIGVVGVQFKLNGVNLGPEVTTAPYSTSWDTKSVPDGSYTLTAVARDAAGSQTTSAAVTVKISTALVEPTGLVSQCSSDAKTFTVSWNPVAGAENYYLRVDNLANNGGQLGFFVEGVDYYQDAYTRTSFTASVIAGQDYLWWVHGANAASGIGPSAIASFKCTDTISPTVSITAPLAGAVVSGTATISASASDNLGVVGVQFKLNGANLGSEVTAAPYTLSWDTKLVANGSYSLTAVARDLAGNQATSAAVAVTVGGALVEPTGLTSQCSSDLKTFTVSWNPVAGAENYYVRVDYLANNGSTAVWVAGYDYYVDAYTQTSLTGSVVAGQQYQWWVHGANAAQGIGPSAAATFTCVDSTPPTVSIQSPLAGAIITGNSVTVSASASDNVKIAGVQFKLNGANLGNEDVSAPYSVSWNTKKVASGVYTLQAVARDTAGNQTTSTTVSVTVKRGGSSGIQKMDSNGVPFTEDDEAENVTIGYARLSAGASADGVAVISLMSGDNVVSETSVQPSESIREGRAYVNLNGAVNTGLAMANDSNDDAVITFYFTDHAGTNFAPGSFMLPAKHNIAAFVNQAPFNLPVSMEGSMTFSSSVPVAVTTIRGFTNERGEFLMTTLPVVSLAADKSGSSLVLPQFADGNGWSTQVVLTNPTDAPLAGTVQFFGTASTETAASSVTVNGVTDSRFSYTIAPRSAVRLVTATPDSDVHVGYVVVTASGTSPVPDGISLFSFSRQGITVSEAAVPAVPAGVAFHTYVESVGTLRSALAIANPSALPAQVSLELTGVVGSSAGSSRQLEIPAGGHIAQFIDELFPAMADGFEGTLRVVSTQPVSATGLRVRNNERGDLVITSVPVRDAASPATKGSGLVFPIIVNGGGYSTDFIGTSR